MKTYLSQFSRCLPDEFSLSIDQLVWLIRLNFLFAFSVDLLVLILTRAMPAERLVSLQLVCRGRDARAMLLES
jgi:hypothetical protein